jgi:tetratricopeptide (TPR) repeat protein
MKSGRSSFLLALLCGWLASGCALQAPHGDTTETTESDAPSTADVQPEPPVRPFPPETLYSLLAAEIAGSRQQYDIALSNYAQQARETRDPQVAERATMIARYLNDNDAASENARLWVELAPGNDDALGNAAFTLMQDGQLLTAFDMSRRLQERGKETLFQSIAANSGSLSPADRELLLQEYLKQLQIHPTDEQLLIGTGLIYQLQGQPEQALEYARAAVKFHRKSVPATLLESSLLHQLKQTSEAIAKLAAQLEQQPDNLRLRLQYARLLAHQDLPKAQEQFEILVKQSPDDPDLLLSLALVAMEAKDLAAARKSLEQLLDLDQQESIANFYLGQIAEMRGDQTQAILHYLLVKTGDKFLQATVNLLNILVGQGDLTSANEHIARLTNSAPEQAANYQLLYAQALTRHRQFDAAETVLNQALVKSPANTHLLYARAMLFEKQDRLAETETDLRRIIELDSENAMAMNTLGYLLVDRTERLDEAGDLLLKAITLSPNDPAIIDSVGWLHYRTGNYSEALIYLRRAFAIYPDAEIAAHLGEVLWKVNQQEEARQVWQQSLELFPDSEIIKTTMDRLQAAP